MLKFEFFKIAIFVLITIMFALILVLISMLSVKDFNIVFKRKPVECGGQTFGSGKNRIEINFFIVSLIFIIFEIETLIIIP